MPEFDQEEYDYFMRHNSRLARLEANPEVQRRFEEIFRENGWKTEDGLTPAAMFLRYAINADANALNGERKLFDEKWTDEKLTMALAERAKGLGSTSREVGRTLDAVKHHHIHDSFMARMAKKDFEKTPTLPDTGGRHKAAAQEEFSRANELRHYASASEAAVPYRETHTVGGDSLHEAISNAFDAHAGDE